MIAEASEPIINAVTPDNRDPLLDVFAPHDVNGSQWLNRNEWAVKFTFVMVERGVHRETTLQHLRRVLAICVQEQRSAEELFGPADKYAISLPASTDATRRSWALSITRAVALGSFAISLGADGAHGPLTASDLTWRLGPLLGAILLMATIAIGTRGRSSGWAVAGLLGVMAISAVLALTLLQPVFQTPRAASMVTVTLLGTASAFAASWLQWSGWPRDRNILRRNWLEMGIVALPAISLTPLMHALSYLG